ncbi:MAG: hypothetical protein M3T49_07940 [Candidatus Eremiobacteraeota bacterium]|nr:hypothetical protein [Candidatus Eremiobacteraeota bacterium]
MVLFRGDYSPDGFFRALEATASVRRRVRATGEIRILLLGAVGAAAARIATRPIATGAFSFPVFNVN